MPIPVSEDTLRENPDLQEEAEQLSRELTKRSGRLTKVTNKRSSTSERKRKRAEQEENAKQEKAQSKLEEAKSYLRLWADRQSGCGWRFKKQQQNWLLRNCFDRDVIDKECFGLLCPYLASIQGGASEQLRKRALDITESVDSGRSVDEQEARLRKKVKSEVDKTVKKKVLKLKATHKRARRVLRILKGAAELSPTAKD